MSGNDISNMDMREMDNKDGQSKSTGGSETANLPMTTAIKQLEGKNITITAKEAVWQTDNGIAFKADNPGDWMFHCHDLHYVSAGIVTQVKYDGFNPSL